MTDNEIIKALECCMFITPNKKCNECPKFNEDVECSVKLHRHALDLINRQKAEIERLEKNFDTMCFVTAKRWVKEEKIKAIKEFAERLKERVYSQAVCIKIDALVEEMTEVQE